MMCMQPSSQGRKKKGEKIGKEIKRLGDRISKLEHWAEKHTETPVEIDPWTGEVSRRQEMRMIHAELTGLGKRMRRMERAEDQPAARHRIHWR